MHNPTCLWDGCDRQAFARGLCQRCHMRARRAGIADQFRAPPRVCDRCGAEFETGKNGKHLYCSIACQRAAVIQRRAEDRATLPARYCDGCGSEIARQRRADARFCSTACQQAQWYESDAERLRAASRKWATSNPELRNEAEHRRRARKLSLPYDSIDRVQVWEASGGICALCGEQIDAALRHPDPMSRSLDHIIPLSAGGHHIRANVQITHLRCNLRKGVKIGAF